MEVGIHVAFRAQWTNVLAGSSPVIAIVSIYKTINSQAFQLLAYAALDSDKPVLHPTHELITQVGVVQLDLRLKDSFVFPTRRSAHTNKYGLAVLDPSKIGMQQQ